MDSCESVEKLKLPSTGSETIMIVEDEDGVRALASRVLQLKGYSVLEAHHGEEALLITKKHNAPIHLLLTDVVMPHMGGRELAERMLPSNPHMKVLYMSGYTSDAIVRYGVLDPHISFVQKPFTPETLTVEVRKVLDAPTPSMM